MTPHYLPKTQYNTASADINRLLKHERSYCDDSQKAVNMQIHNVLDLLKISYTS